MALSYPKYFTTKCENFCLFILLFSFDDLISSLFVIDYYLNCLFILEYTDLITSLLFGVLHLYLK